MNLAFPFYFHRVLTDSKTERLHGQSSNSVITWRSQTYLVGQTNRKQCHDDLVISSSSNGCDLVSLPIRAPACHVAGHLSLVQSLPRSVKVTYYLVDNTSS